MKKNETMPLLSVIIPTYSVEKYIRECLFTVVEQTYTNLEIIIIDDASTDSTPQIIKEYAQKDSRIRAFFHEENKGPGSTRNEGLRLASGEYVTFVDHDDSQDVTKYEQMMQRALETDADITFCRSYDLDMLTRKTTEPYEIPYSARETDNYRLPVQIMTWAGKNHLLNHPLNTFGPPWTKIVRNELIKNFGIKFAENGNRYDDVLYHYLVIYNADTVAFVDDTLCTHRFFEESITGNAVLKNRDVFFDILKTWDELELYADKYDLDHKSLLYLYLEMMLYHMWTVEHSYRYYRRLKKILRKYGINYRNVPSHLKKIYRRELLFFSWWRHRAKYFQIRIKPIKKEYKIVLFGKRLLWLVSWEKSDSDRI